MPFTLIVGLGNPGKQYEDTRHNVGFMVLDRLAAATGAVFQSAPKWQSHLAKIPGSGTILLKPQTFMNLSGRAIQQVLSFHKWTPEQMLVIYDDVALPLGTLRFREKGSAGGHNGIKSILQHRWASIVCLSPLLAIVLFTLWQPSTRGKQAITLFPAVDAS